MRNLDTLYFDFQASTPVANEVLRKMRPYFTESFANPHASDHVLGWKAAAAVETAAMQVGRLIGADQDEIIFTSGATESNNLAILGLARRAATTGNPRNRILLSAIEHKCTLSTGRALKEQLGYSVDLIPVDKKGHVIPKALEALLGDDVLLVSIMAVNNEIGSIQDLDGLSRIIRKTEATFHCDAAQAPVAIDMKNLAALTDMLSLSGHKMYGPKGVGALYIRRDLQDKIEPLMYGGEQQNGLRPGTLATPLCVGMGAAAQYISSEDVGIKRDELRTRTSKMIDMLTALPREVELYGDTIQNRHPGNISVGFKGFRAQDILGALQPHLAASSGSACTSGFSEPSHVLKAIGLPMKEANSVIRFSLGFESSDQEVLTATGLLSDALAKLSDA